MKVFVPMFFTLLAMTVGILTVYFTSPKPSQTCEPTFQRTMKSSIVSSSQPRSLAIGDLNNDHQIDIVVANSGTNTIGIFISLDNGTFVNQQIYSTGSESHPYSIVVSDFNNDNHLDIAVANYDTNNIGIFLGYGNGTFINQKVFSLGSSRPLFLAVGDFNNDGRMDIVAVNNGTNTIGILLGYGNGSFQDQTTYSTAYDSIPCSIAVGDFNKDNQLDIAVANSGTDNIGIFLAYGNGTFASQQTYPTVLKSNPSSIAVGDFNNDKQLDIVVANYGTSNVGIFLGHGNGSFLAQITYSIGTNSHPQYITVGDLNKDNELDIVIVDSENDEIYILPGYGNGSFATTTTYDAVPGSNPFCVAVTDFNNNNQSDIVVANYGTNNVLVLIDYYVQPSARPTNYPLVSSGNAASAAVGNFNNDQILDIVATADNFVFILIGLGNGNFDQGATYSTGNDSFPQYVCVGDLNADNQIDAVVADFGYDSAGVFLGYGNGTFADMTTYSTGSGSQPYWIALGDVNNDNVLDIVSANTGSNTVGILLGNGDGTFATVMTYSARGYSPYSLTVGDIDNENNLDLAVAVYQGYQGYVFIYRGLGNGSFIFQYSYSTGADSYPFSIALADLNDDNYLDITVANIYGNNVGVFLGYGNGTFTQQTTYSTGDASQPYYVIVADFNNDNISDIAATNFGSDEVVIFYGYGNGSFELITIYSTGSAPQPYSVAIGDFNNDNRSDIVVANSGTGNLSILFDWDNDMFGMEMMYPIGTNSDPQYVITCDINRDNHLDIVSANSKNNSISVIMGYGNGNFAEQMIYSTEDNSHPYAVVSGDLSNDNRLDLIIANEGIDSIGIFFGFDYTSFHNEGTYSDIHSSGPSGIVVGDFNNDNYLDIAATFFDSNSIGILLGCGNGSFTSMMIYSTGNDSQPWGIAIGDFNNDGRLDIFVANYGTNNIGVFLGYGNGSFAAITTYSTGYDMGPANIVVGDLNNDNQLDIVVVNCNSSSVGVLLGYGNRRFSIIETYPVSPNSFPRSVTVGDFNNDGNLDIAVSNTYMDNVGVLLGYGNGTFENQITFSTGDLSYPIWVTVGDFNSDNQLDIATANWDGNNVGILLGYGNGTFAAMNSYSTGVSSQPKCINIGDFNNDNILDIAVANYGTNDIVVLFGFRDGSFLLGTPYSTGINSLPEPLAIGDFNNDSQLDIAVANFQSSNIVIFLGYDNEPFGSITPYTTGDGSQPNSVAIGDFNNDSWPDIVVANYGTDNVGILFGHGDEAFDPIVTYPTGINSAPYSVAVADFNNDHHLDIVVTNSETNTVSILLGYGNETFATGMTYSTGVRSNPYTVAIGDFNNDNISDIVVANSGTSNIFLLYGYGNGTFENGIPYPLGYGYNPYSVAVGNLNQDNWVDIVIACYSTDHIETLIKMC